MTEETTEAAANDKLERLKKRIRTARDKVTRVKLARDENNAEINEARASMEADGIPKAAFDMALRYAGWDSNRQRGFDRAYAIVRDSLGLEVEADLFTYKDGVLPQTPPKKDTAAKAAPKPAAKAAESSPAKPASRPRNPAKVKAPTPAELAAQDARKQQEQREQTEGAQLVDGKLIN